MLVKPGWLAIYGKEAAEEVADAKDGDKGQSLVPVKTGERVNVAGHPGAAEVMERMRELAAARWNLDAYDSEVRESQARRWIVYEALRNGAYFPWDYQPLMQASERYMRNHMDLNVLEDAKRFPRGE